MSKQTGASPTKKQAQPQSNAKYNVVFVLGGPGAGKGTQCANLVRELGYVHLSAGDLLRAEQARAGSQYGALIQEHIKNGTIVPVEITCALLENAMREQREQHGKNDFLVDGFPRNQDNLQGWVRAMDTKTTLSAVLNFDCSDEVCIDRCLKRGSAGSGRADDNLESLKKRLKTHVDQTKPIIEHYAQLGLVHRIDANGSAEQVWEAVRQAVASFAKH